MTAHISIVKQDITTMKVDAIVNAANERLAGGGGVDGAIHKAAGPKLAIAAKAYAPLPTGEAVTTDGYKLPSKWVIHTVGPIWDGKGSNESKYEQLANCYMNSFIEANRVGAKTIAIPAISTGVYGFPKKDAAMIAVMCSELAADRYEELEEIYLVCFDDESYKHYEEAITYLSMMSSAD